MANATPPTSSAGVADALVRLGFPLRSAPAGLIPIDAATKLIGRCVPTKHVGSVDVFLEACHAAATGSVLVIDDQGRTDRACVGDLTVAEAGAAGLAGVVVWGRHRDHAQLAGMQTPVFSYGRAPNGPTEVDPRPADALTTCHFGSVVVTSDDWIVADADGAVFVASSQWGAVAERARLIEATERAQADKLADGQSLFEQLQMQSYLQKRQASSGYGFREHLRAIGGAIEE